VSGAIDGFHRDKEVYGGKVLNALRNNAQKDRKDTADRLERLIVEHKELWLDQVIFARDQLIHPEKGMHQLMFHLAFAERDSSLVCVELNPPQIEGKPIHLYAKETLQHVTDFCLNFLRVLRGTAVSNDRQG
jgi:hypothetical protein